MKVANLGSFGGRLIASLTAALFITIAPAHAGEVIVTQIGLEFDPVDIEASPGDTVRWMWTTSAHTVTSGTPCEPDGVFFDEDLNSLAPEVIWEVPAAASGVIEYFCIPHCLFDMTGTITIKGGPVPCPADLDGSTEVGFPDLLRVLSAWGPCGGPCPEDLDGSTSVDFGDVLAVLSAWGPCE